MFKILFLALVASLVACATAATDLAYVAQPERIQDPHTEVKSILLANTSPGCVSTPEFTENMFIVKFVCARAIGNQVVRLDKIQSIAVQQNGVWYSVLIKHSSAADDFLWTSKDLNDMQRLADAFAALSSRTPTIPAAAPTL